MAFIIDTINGSGLYAQSAASASVATYDSNGNVITATYLTGVDLTPYQTTAGMTAYATTGDVANKLDTTAFSDVSGTFLTAHQSLDGYATTAWVDSQGYLTAHQPISADEWNDVYDTVNAYSGSWTGSESSPTASVDSNGSIDIVSSNNTVYFDVNGTWFNNAVNSALPTSSVQWNSNYDTVNTNSGVWGGSALPISAGPGISAGIVNDTLVFRNDETVLFDNSGNVGKTNISAYSLSESVNNFDRVRISFTRGQNFFGDQCFEYNVNSYPKMVTLECYDADGNNMYRYFCSFTITGTTFTELDGKCGYTQTVNGSTTVKTSNWLHPYKIIGINRKNSV